MDAQRCGKFEFIGRLVPRLAVGMAQVGLCTVHACCHGFSTRHAGLGHGRNFRHLCGFFQATGAHITRHSELRKQQADQHEEGGDEAGATARHKNNYCSLG